MSAPGGLGAEPVVPVVVIVGFAVVVALLAAARVRRSAPPRAVARFVAAGALAVLIAVGPTMAGGRAEARQSAADVLFVVDTTASMAAEDYDGDRPRLDGVRADISALAAAFPGAHFSLVRVDSQARIEVPWTTDVAAIETAAAVLRQERAVYSTGSQAARALDVVDRQIPRPSDDGADADRYTVVFYLSDGEQTAQSDGAGQASLTELTAGILGEEPTAAPTATFESLSGQIDAGAVLGYGTAAGAPMLEFTGERDRDVVTDEGYVIDHATGTRAISRFDEDALRGIADELGVPFLHREAPGGLTDVATEIAAGGSFVDAGDRATRRPLYWIPAIGLLGLVVWQLVASARELRDAGRLLRPPPARRPGSAGAAPSRPAAPADRGVAA